MQYKSINIILVIMIVLMSLSQSVFAGDINNQLLRHYHLDGDASEVLDNLNDGIIYGSIAAKDLREIDSTAMSFDGVDDNITVPSIGNWGNNLSFSFWVNIESNSTGSQILIGSRDLGNGPTLINFYISVSEQGTMVWQQSSFAASTRLETIELMPKNQWVHVICDWSMDTGLMNIYWNTQLIASDSVQGVPRYLNAEIGLGGFCEGCGDTVNSLKGRMDEVRVYDRLLTTEEKSFLSGITRVYPLDNHTNDTSGNEKHGENFGALATEDLYNNENSAFEFDGVDNVINIPTIGNWGSELSFSMLVKPNSQSAGLTQTLIGSRQSGSGSTLANLLISINENASLRWIIFSNGAVSQIITEPGIIKFDKWNQIVCDWSELTGHMRIFINGTLIISDVIADTPRFKNYNIGIGNFNAEYNSTSSPYHGIIDQVNIYNRLLTQEDIKDLNDVIFSNDFE